MRAWRRTTNGIGIAVAELCMSLAALDLVRLSRLSRLLEDNETSLGEKVDRLYDFLFANDGFRDGELRLSSCRDWDAESLENALHFAEKIIVLYTHYFFEPSLLHVTFYRKQRRVAAALDRELSPILCERILRRGQVVPEDDPFLREPIFWFKKEVRTKAFRKQKTGFAHLEDLRERLHSKLLFKKVS